MNEIKNIIHKILSYCNFLDIKDQISITNMCVMIFAAIVAFRTLFAGLHLSGTGYTWEVQSIDISSTLGFLFSLWNYNEKRKVINNNEKV